VPDTSEDLWQRTEQLIRSSLGWSLQPLRVLGRPREGRRTWVAQGEPGLVIVKAAANPFAAARASWAPQALAALAGRGYPVPKMLWHGLLDERWSLAVLEQLPGEPLRTLDDSALEALLALVELQRDVSVDPGGWDSAEWVDHVLFDRWDGWWEAAEAAAPETSRRLHAFVEPARGYRLPGGDLVHGDLNLSNVLAEGGTITGVVDWDAIGHGSRASDLAGLLFDWHRLRLDGGTVATVGDTRIVNRIAAVAGDEGLRCAIGYGAVARLGLTAQRCEHADLATWRRVTDEILAPLGA
jgi:aminoglycoside phosphotransferase (APT) family kinase protein